MTHEDFNTALRQLATGQLGDAYANSLYRATAAAARRGSFPPPEGHQRWSGDAIAEIAHDFAADPNTDRRLATILTRSTSGAQFARLLTQAVRNFLRDKARDTDRGHAIQRLRDVLDEDDRFQEQQPAGHPRAWRLFDQPDEPSPTHPHDLVEAAFTAADVTIVRWTGRRGPIAERDELASLLEAILERAHGAVDERVLVEIIERRLGLVLDATVDSLDDIAMRDWLAADDDIAEDADVRAAVKNIWPELTERDRVMLAHFEQDVRELGNTLGLGKSAAADARAKLVESLTAWIGAAENGQQILDVLRQRAEAWFLDRTSDADNSSTSRRRP